VVNRRPAPGLIHHSDRGSQYAAKEYRDRLEALGMRGSMGHKGNPYDNAYCREFLQDPQALRGVRLRIRNDGRCDRAVAALHRQIYNRRRLHSAPGYVPPEEYELQ
jgi:putative transposase